MAKLKLREIINLINAGKQNEVEKHYTIRWNGIPPHLLYDNIEVPRERMTITGNITPLPTRAWLTGSIVPFETYGRYRFKPIDFGEVIIDTCFEAENLIFEYDADDENMDSKALMDFIRLGSEAVTGRAVKKADICFNLKFDLDDAVIELKNVMFTDINFKGVIDNASEVKSITAKLLYDFSTIDFK